MSDIPAGRICKGCDQWKLLDEFHRDKYGQYGRSSRCKDCKRQSDYQRQPKLPSTLDRRALQAQGLKRCYRCKEAKKPEEFYKQTGGLFGRTSICKKCSAIEHREWKDKNPDYGKKWYAKHRDRLLADYQANHEKYREYQRQYHAKNRDKMNAYNRQWRADNPEKAAGYGRKWREKNPEYFKELNQERWKDPVFREKQRERSRRYNAEHKEERRKRKQEWRKKNQARETEYMRRRRARKAKVVSNFSHDDWLKTLEDQEHKCKYCGKLFSDDLPPTVDHVWPLVKGGGHTAINIVAACKPCNARKQGQIPKQLRLFPAKSGRANK